MSESLPSTTHATDSKLLKSDSVVRSRESVITSAFLPICFSKIAACEFLSSSSLDSYMRRTYPEESILAWTDRSLLLLE